MKTFRIKAVPSDGACTLILSGEADLAVAQDIVELGTASLQDPTQLLVIDLADLTVFDSSAIGALVQLRDLAEEGDKRLVLSRTPGRVQQLHALTGLAETFLRQTDLLAPVLPAAPDPDCLPVDPNSNPSLPRPRAWGS